MIIKITLNYNLMGSFECQYIIFFFTGGFTLGHILVRSGQIQFLNSNAQTLYHSYNNCADCNDIIIT